jgi:hypothetical protein
MVALDKPRRGARRHMDVPLTSLPRWASPAASHDAADELMGGGDRLDLRRLDLRSPFGVFLLLHELAAPARQILGSDRLFAWHCSGGGGPGRPGRGLRTAIDSCLVRAWARRHDLPADTATDTPGRAEQLSVTLRLLRLTYAELAQRPVAHTDATLANEYLLRNRGNLAEYQSAPRWSSRSARRPPARGSKRCPSRTSPTPASTPTGSPSGTTWTPPRYGEWCPASWTRSWAPASTTPIARTPPRGNRAARRSCCA